MKGKRKPPKIWGSEEFYMSFEPELNSGCWIWSRGTMGNGYGCLRSDGKIVLAHRFSWNLHFGEIPHVDDYHGMCVLHRCDVPSCVNPSHLFLGTNKDNIADRVSKGRTVAPLLRGMDSPTCKISEQQVLEIRRLRGIVSGVDIARQFSVSPSAVSAIQTGKSRRFDGFDKTKTKRFDGTVVTK